MDEVLYVIEVPESLRSGRGRWWKAKRANYTNRPEMAGVYTEAQVRKAIGGMESERGEKAVPVGKVFDLVLGTPEGTIGALLKESIEYRAKDSMDLLVTQAAISEAIANPKGMLLPLMTVDQVRHDLAMALAATTEPGPPKEDETDGRT